MTTPTLASFKEALAKPFDPETILFLPKDIRQEQGHWVCLALPYANKRTYEDRLNELVFGEWSTPHVPPFAQGNKLIVPATVVVLGIAHSDYGEAFLTATGRHGVTREDENTATEAYSQAFRRACAKFGVGRYLYDLPKLRLPYDPHTRQIAVGMAERVAWVEKLYKDAGLLPHRFTPAGRQATQAAQAPTAPRSTVVLSPSSTQPGSRKPVIKKPTASPAAPQPTSMPFLKWVTEQVNHDPARIQHICNRYHVMTLDQLSPRQQDHLTQKLIAQSSAQPASLQR